MRVIILTSSIYGIAAYAGPLLYKEPDIEISMIVFNEGLLINKKKYYLKKISKIFKIGLFGALNGIRMRRWFGKEVEKFLPTVNLEIFCNQNNIEFRRTPTINSNTTKDLFKKANADIGISLGNSFISKSVFSICSRGMINVHGEILPDYQNAQSIIWQLYNNSAETGYTIHKINQRIDQGDILYKEKLPIIFRDTLRETIAYNCAEITRNASIALIRIIKNFDFYNESAIPQGVGKHYTTPNIRQFIRIKKHFSLLKSRVHQQLNK
jgi:methionyl-tRNA formyltransferase